MTHYTRHRGDEALTHFHAIATLRMKVFHDFPYLYDGSYDYEKRYLQTYFSCPESFLCLCWNGDNLVGATTGVPLQYEEAAFQKTFLDHGIPPNEVFYFGESILLGEYRGRGLGKQFFIERERFATSLRPFGYLSFCAVIRPQNHPMRPADYRPLDAFWKNRGFAPVNGFTTQYSWKDVGDSHETKKNMQFWLKNLKDK